MAQLPAAGAPPQDAPAFNPTPFSNPTHPAHVQGARHFGAAIGHLLTGNGEAAAHHLGQALGHAIAPHMPEATGARVTDSLRAAAHGAPAPTPATRKKEKARNGK